MHVVFLGTGASEGIPALFCTCELCVQARRREGRNFRSRVQQIVARRVLIDWPPDTLMHSQAAGLQLDQVDHVLFTHGHGDHCSPADMRWCRGKGMSRLREGPPLHVWAQPDTLAVLGVDDPASVAMELHPLAAFEPVDLGDGLVVTPIRAQHWWGEVGTGPGQTSKPAVNFLFADGQSVYLLGYDTGWYPAETWDFLAHSGRPITAAALDCSLGKKDTPADARHLGIDRLLDVRGELIETGAMLPDARVFATHISHSGGLLHESLEAAFSGTGVEVAYDGLQVDV